MVLRIDSKICFVGIANHLGTLIASSYRPNLITLLTTEETAHYVLQSVLRSATREDFESKLGTQEYSIGKYRNVIRETVPIVYIDEDTMTGKVKFYLLLSFDIDYGEQQTIETKILPLYW